MKIKQITKSQPKIFCSTWQSIHKQPKKYFEQFKVVIGDECHSFKAKCLTTIMEKLENCPFRFGTTGTLEDCETNRMVLEGLFGRVFVADETQNMIKKNELSNLKIKCVVLKYDEETRKNNKKLGYADEVRFIVNNEKRNKLIANLAVKQPDTTLVLFQYITHGQELYNIIKNSTDKKVFYVSGDTDADTREKIRQEAESTKNCIIVASTGVFSTGTNIRNLYSIIFASPSKAKIKILQSIGRVLRIGDRGNSVTLYDIVDDFSHKSHKNFALKHFLERLKIYNREKFENKLFSINM